MDLIIIVIILVIFYILNFVKENFYNFVNVPAELGLPIDDIEVSPIVGIPKIIHHICTKNTF